MNSISDNSLTAFDFNGAAVRIIMRDGEPWFVMSDVCAVLEISNPRDAASRLDEDEKGVVITDTLGGPQKTLIINESGMYALVLTSRKPEAKVFKKWVTGTVLPEIRRTGSYQAPMSPISFDLSDPEFAIALCLAQSQRALAEKERADKAEKTVAILKPQANALRVLVEHEGAESLRMAAKNCGIPPQEFNKLLREWRWIYDVGHDILPYQDKLNAGYLVMKTQPVKHGSGKTHCHTTTLVTVKGKAKIALLYQQHTGRLL